MGELAGGTKWMRSNGCPLELKQEALRMKVQVCVLVWFLHNLQGAMAEGYVHSVNPYANVGLYG